jgi:hypothetical protein
MKKRDQKRLDEALDKALAPPRQRPKQNLDALLDEYDDGQSSAKAEKPLVGIPAGIPIATPEDFPEAFPANLTTQFLAIEEKSSPKRAHATKLNEETDPPTEPGAPLDATHTAAERSVYSIMYRETISKGTYERHFGPAELMKKTGIRSRNTVHKALYGLIEKLSVEVVSEARGNPLGPRYRIHKPQAIEQRRKVVGIKIDTQTKKIVESATIPPGIPASIPTAIPKNWDTTLPKIGIPTIPIFGRVLNIENNSYVERDTASSSSKFLSDSEDDAAFLEAVREVYERATGNEWSTSDAITAQKGRDIFAEVWGIAICYCVDRAPGHTFGRLAYVLEQAREHAGMMKNYSQSDLRAILRHSLSVIERARAAGKWTLNEAGGETNTEN